MEMRWAVTDGTTLGSTLQETSRRRWWLPEPLTQALLSLVKPEDVTHGGCRVFEEKQSDQPLTRWEGLWLTDRGVAHITGQKRASGWRHDRGIEQAADEITAVLHRLCDIRSLSIVGVEPLVTLGEGSSAWNPKSQVTFDDGTSASVPLAHADNSNLLPAANVGDFLVAIREAWLSG